MRTRALFLLSILLVFFLSSCNNRNTSSQDPFAGMTLATISDHNTLAKATVMPISTPGNDSSFVSDDFSAANGLWQTEEDEYGKAAYGDGNFVIQARQKSQTMWSTYSGIFSDVKIEVDAQALDAGQNENNGFGIDCRVQENGDGYSFHISSDGYYAILKFEDTDGIRLVDWTWSDAIHLGESNNHLQAICQGTHLELWVNDIQLTSVEDSTFTSGAVSLSATTYADEPASISFDNFKVYNLEQ